MISLYPLRRSVVQKKLAGLAKLLVLQPDILLLDEPDNHLDLDGKAYPSSTATSTSSDPPLTSFSELNLIIQRGHRVGLVGPNRAGKTLLFRLILEFEKPSTGQVTIGPSVKIGYYSQEQDTLDFSRTLIDKVRLA